MRIIDQAVAVFKPRTRMAEPVPDCLSLALQGGGSFGAFTWGVLDRLLEERELRFDIVSGASAGAVNASLLVSGLCDGGPEGARAKLESFWRRMSNSAAFLPLRAAPGMRGGIDLMTRMFAPAQLNPFDLNPLREALLAEVDFQRIAAEAPVRLMIAATRVSDGKARVFQGAEIDVEAVLASACLPLLHRAIEIDGETYWDGGYSANPPLIPIARETGAREILIVRATPGRVARIPSSPRDISRRVDQIAFNATLNSEIEALRLASEIGGGAKWRDLRVSDIAADDAVDDLADRSASDLDWAFLTGLRDSGRAAATRWLATSPFARAP